MWLTMLEYDQADSGKHRRADHRVRHDLQVHVQALGHGELSRSESADVSQVAGQAGADARRGRTGEMRRVRAVRGGVPGGRDLPGGGGKRRYRHGGAALRRDLPDPQDALHLLRVLRGSVPRVGDFHGQGLRAGGLQQERLHLGQNGSSRSGPCRRTNPPHSDK